MSTIAAALFCLVVGVTDGDTLTARCGEPGAYQQIKVRLAEIDAPERKQPFYGRSRQALVDMCMHAEATITPTARDRYQRIVGRVSCRGEDANSALVRKGLAWAYTQYLTDPSIAQLQQQARAARRGLWVADGTAAPPVAPWEWRKGRGREPSAAQSSAPS